MKLDKETKKTGGRKLAFEHEASTERTLERRSRCTSGSSRLFSNQFTWSIRLAAPRFLFAQGNWICKRRT